MIKFDETSFFVLYMLEKIIRYLKFVSHKFSLKTSLVKSSRASLLYNRVI